jgi:hypothetical protein
VAKQNLTVSLEQRTIRRARVLAAERGVSVSKLVADSVDNLVARADEYESSRRNALELLERGFHMGKYVPVARERLHDRR